MLEEWDWKNGFYFDITVIIIIQLYVIIIIIVIFNK